MKKTLLFFALSLSLFADLKIDTYILDYTGKTKKCILKKDTKIIPVFDKKFKVNKPIHDYTCYSVQKEMYKSCKITNKNSITALIFSYGVYNNTNFIVAFKNTAKTIDANIEIQCSKTLSLK